MHFEYKGIGHPTRKQLTDFAESLLDRQAPVSAVLAAHVSGCEKCAAEARRVRASLELAELARLPEPSGALTQEIVLRARAELHRRGHEPKAVPVSRFLQFAACAVAAVLLAVYSFSTALDDAAGRTHPPMLSRTSPPADPALDAAALLERAAAVRALSASVSIRQSPDSPREDGYRRALEMLDDDLNAALAALQRNPGSARANQVMLMSLERQLEGLRGLYLDRTF